MVKDFMELAQEMQDDINRQREELDNVSKSITMRTGKVKKRETAAEEKEKQLSEWEKALDRKYEEISRLENSKLMELRANEQMELATSKLTEARTLEDKAKEVIKEAEFREQQILEREMAVTEREKTFREKIRREFADSFVAGITGKK